MIRKKICMLGAFAVGKTSLVARYVQGVFSERYLTTVGVKIDKKEVDVDGRSVGLVLWDLHGEDEFQRVRESYLRGSSGLFLVADGLRKGTVDQALALHDTARRVLGNVPAILLLNKVDLVGDWEVSEDMLRAQGDSVLPLIRTSAKTGEGVEAAFATLARRMVLGGAAHDD